MDAFLYRLYQWIPSDSTLTQAGITVAVVIVAVAIFTALCEMR